MRIVDLTAGEMKEIHVDRVKSTPRVGPLRVGGGLVRMPADQIDFSAYYTFEEVHDGKTYRWTDVRPLRDGNDAVFRLESQSACSW